MTKFQQTGPVRWWVESWAWWSEGVILTSCHCHISVLRSADLWSEEQQAGLMWGGGVTYLVNNAEATKESKFKEKKKFTMNFTIVWMHLVERVPQLLKSQCPLETCSPVWVQQRKGGSLSVSLWTPPRTPPPLLHTSSVHSSALFGPLSSCPSLLIFDL